MPKDIYDIQEQTFQVLIEVLGLLKQQQERLDELHREVGVLREKVKGELVD